MAEIEGEPIKITLDDIQQASQLSLACPMCAGPVYREYNDPAMAPVECVECGTIYHRACWEQAGGKCAMVGCDCTRIKAFNAPPDQPAPSVAIRTTDIRARGPEITEELKRQQQRMRREFEAGSLLGRFLRWLWDQIKIG